MVDAFGASVALVVHVITPLAIEHRGSFVDPVVFAGMASVTVAPTGTVDGPLLVSVIVYVVDVPAVTAVTPSVLLTDRSADFVTVSVSLPLLFPLFGSATGLLVTAAVLVRLVPL